MSDSIKLNSLPMSSVPAIAKYFANVRVESFL